MPIITSGLTEFTKCSNSCILFLDDWKFIFNSLSGSTVLSLVVGGLSLPLGVEVCSGHFGESPPISGDDVRSMLCV